MQENYSLYTCYGDRRSHIEDSKYKKVILLYCCTLTYDDVQ